MANEGETRYRDTKLPTGMLVLDNTATIAAEPETSGVFIRYSAEDKVSKCLLIRLNFFTQD